MAQQALVRNQVPGCTLGLSTCLVWSPGGTVNAFPWQALFWTASLSFQAGGMVRMGAQNLENVSPRENSGKLSAPSLH